MSAFDTALEISRASSRVLQRHRRLLWFPLLSLATAIAIVMLFAPFLPEIAAAEGGVAIVALYFALELSGVFFAVALTSQALRALRRQPTSVPDGLSAAAARPRALAEYAGIESTVGLALGLLGRGGRGVSFAQQIFGAAWAAVSYLAIPVLVAEKRGGYDSLVRSGRLLEKTWGETSVAELGLRIVTANFALVVAVLLVLLSRAVDEVLAIVLVAALALAFAVVVGALQAIYRSALYLYAAEGVIPDDFDTPEMKRVWRTE